MLVFVSDVHLTDGTSGTTIVPLGFQRFCDSLMDIVREQREPINIRNLEIVLLGDIFDVIRSSLWLRSENLGSNPVRPWSRADLVDNGNWNLQTYTEAIVKGIVENPRNIRSMTYLKDFTDWCASRDVNVTFSYIIGNHDWLINRFASTRQAIADFVGLSSASSYRENRFPEYHVFEDYGVMARHGDYYDSFNYEGNRDASSLGDAIVIDLLNRFAVQVQQDPVIGSIEEVVNQLRQIDNVRPLWAVPAWIQGICNDYMYAEVEEKLHKIWNGLVEDFFEIPFVKSHEHFGPDALDLLKMALRLSSAFSFSRLKDILGNKLIRHLSVGSDDYRRYAYNEAALKNNHVKYVVYGHTHRAEQVPLDVIKIPEQGFIEKIYFNTGTWRKVFEQTCFDEDKCIFVGWHVGTFILFYSRVSGRKTGATRLGRVRWVM